MDSDSVSPNQESNELKAEFRKLTNEAAHRKYRRRSPVDGKSDEDASPERDRSSRGNRKASDYERRNDDRLDDRRSGRSRHGHSRDSYRHSSRGNRHDEHSRYGKHADEDDRSDYTRSRDRYRDMDRYSRDRSERTGSDGRHGNRYDDRDRHARDRDNRDEKREYRSYRDHRSDKTISYEDSVGDQSDSKFKREMGDVKDLDGKRNDRAPKLQNDRLDRYEDGPKLQNDRLDGYEDGHGRAGGKAERRSGFVSEEFAAKRPKLLSEETDVNETAGSKVAVEQTPVGGSDTAANVDAAKVAAMKAAELVNKNLTVTGFMTADQKKKLLWGNKKSTTVEESSSHRWDAAMFSDHERQEKFNKLMGVKGEGKVNSKPTSTQDAEKLQLDLEKQYTAGLRRRDGRTVGLGL